MKTLLTIIFTLIFALAFGQLPKNISVLVVDENGKPVANAVIYYGDRTEDTAYTNKRGLFNVACPIPQICSYYFYIERKGFLPNSILVDLSSVVNKPIVLRSRKGFWYDARKIDSTHLGITVKDAITKYKLDIDECLLWSEPPGSYHNFTTELGDSSYIRFTFKGIFSKGVVKMTDVLDRIITGIGIGFTNGTEKEFGNGWADENPYFYERQMKMRKQ
jgi:hypothetical protein